MHNLLEQLTHYHRCVSAILSQLRHVLDDLNKNPESHQHQQQLFNILNLFYSNGETYHHANEEILCAELALTKAPSQQCADQICADHRHVEEMLKDIKKQHIKAIYSNVISGNFIVMIKNLVNAYSDHIIIEDNDFFPFADIWLSNRQWQSIKQQWEPLTTINPDKHNGENRHIPSIRPTPMNANLSSKP